MVERLNDVPDGVLGYRITGRLTRDEYDGELMTPVYAALDAGQELNLLIEMPEEFHGIDGGAIWEDMKAAGSVGLKHRKAWGRMAVVTEKDWIRHGVAVFGWASPGELRVFDLDEGSEARAWVGGA